MQVNGVVIALLHMSNQDGCTWYPVYPNHTMSYATTPKSVETCNYANGANGEMLTENPLLKNLELLITGSVVCLVQPLLLGARGTQGGLIVPDSTKFLFFH